MVGNEWQEDRNAWRYGSRSQAVWRVVNEMLKANLPDETIASVLLDTRFSISENPLEKGKRARAFAAGEPQTYEEAMAELARMRRVALDRSDQLEDVRTVPAETRAEQQGLRDRIEHLEIFEGIVQKIDEVLSRPDAECSSDDKVFNIAAARWLPFHRSKRLANGQQPTLSLGYLSKVIGMPKRRLSRCLDRSSSDDPAAGAPYQKNLIRKPVIDPETGLQARDDKNKPRWESSLEIIPWRDSPRETLTAAATYTMPERPKRGGSQAASDARWGRCQRHDNTEVRIKGYCPDCGRIVGERMLSVEEFDVLNVQIGHSEPTAPTVPGSDSIGVQNGHS